MASETAYTTPILYIVFNRPDITQRSFKRISRIKPKKLYIFQDGPRNDSDKPLCSKVGAIVENIDWKCKVKKKIQTSNLGLRPAMIEAISWFFEQEPEGVILEDDCMPSRDFFRFCQVLLERYREDERIFMISGNNFQRESTSTDGDYFFSRLARIWGWASWRRAWNYFDQDMKTFPRFLEKDSFKEIFMNNLVASFWQKKINNVYHGGNAWSFIWIYSILSQHGLTICPRVNLVGNIGGGSSGIHSLGKESIFNDPATGRLKDFNEPEIMLPNWKIDENFTYLLIGEQMPELLAKRQVVKRYINKIMSFAQQLFGR